jgi:hypothetical protein
MLRRRIVLLVLALGSLLGFAAGIQSWRFHREFGLGPYFAPHHGRVDALAEACVRAAERLHPGEPAPSAPAP